MPMTTQQARVIDPIVTARIRGYQDPALIGTRLFPRVGVTARAGRIIDFTEEAFLVHDTTHTPGARVGQSDISYSSQQFALADHAHDVVVPRQLREEAAAVPSIDLLGRAGVKAFRVLLRRLELEIAQLATDPANYPTGHKVTLSGTSQWSDNSSNPIVAVTDACTVIQNKIAVRPNTLVMGGAVYDKLINHPKIVERLGGSQQAVVDERVLAAVFQIPNIVVGWALWKGADGTTAAMWGKHAVLAYVRPDDSPTVEDASFGYTYTLEGYPFAEETYWQPERRSWMQGAADCRQPVIAAGIAGYLFQNAVA